jgi:hypothetical protein
MMFIRIRDTYTGGYSLRVSIAAMEVMDEAKDER